MRLSLRNSRPRSCNLCNMSHNRHQELLEYEKNQMSKNGLISKYQHDSVVIRFTFSKANSAPQHVMKN